QPERAPSMEWDPFGRGRRRKGGAVEERARRGHPRLRQRRPAGDVVGAWIGRSIPADALSSRFGSGKAPVPKRWREARFGADQYGHNEHGCRDADLWTPFAVAMTLDLAAHSQRLEALHDLLPTLAGALDVREIFEHLSLVASRILPHDEARLALLCEGGTQFRLYDTRHNGKPDVVSSGDPCPLRDMAEAKLVNSISRDGSAWAGISAPVRIKDHPFGVLAFLARHPGRYSTDDVAFVRWMADCVAIALSHQRLA